MISKILALVIICLTVPFMISQMVYFKSKNNNSSSSSKHYFLGFVGFMFILVIVLFIVSLLGK